MSADRRRGRALRLVPTAGAAWASAALAVCVPAVAVWGAAALWAVAAGLVVAALRHPSSAIVAAAVAAAGAAVTMSHVALAQPDRAAVDELSTGGGRSVVVEATVSGKIDPSPSGEVWFDAVAARIAAGDRAVENGALPVRIGVAVDDAGALVRADIGSAVTVRGRSIPVGAGDRAVLVLRAEEVAVVAERPAALLAVASDLRRGLVASAAGLPGHGAALVPGLAVGDTSAVSGELDESMKASSLSHLTAVSGANCALVVGVAYGAMALCGARRGVRVAAALATLGGFIVLVTPEPSVVRAGAMAAIAMIAVLVGRAGAGISVLCLAVVLLLAVDPWLAVSLGFALSAAATGSLLVLARPLADGLARWMPRALALSLAVPLAAQLVCGPLLVLVDPRVPVLGVAANLLAAPAAPAATLIGLAACLAAPFPWLQHGLAAIAWLPASWIAAIADAVGGLPGQQLPWWGEWAGLAALAVVSASVAVVVAVRPGRGRRWMLRTVAIVVVCAVVGVGGGETALRTVASPWTVPAGWAIAACDVGQGDAVLVRSGAAVALVDTGPDPAALEECLTRFALTRIDLLVLTHFDADHAGGVEAVTGRVGLVVHGPPADRGDERLLDDLRESGAQTRAAHPGMQGILGGARWRVLWPAAGIDPGNDASVALDIRGGGVPDLLMLGDLSEGAQQAMQRVEPVVPVEVVKVAHHGSADQDARLYRAASPVVGLISVGADNTYGHPRESILSTLRALGATVARTDHAGIVALWKEADGALRLWSEREVAGSR